MSSFWIYTPWPLTSACNFLASCAPLNVIPLYPATEICDLKFLKILAKRNSPPNSHIFWQTSSYISCSKTFWCFNAQLYHSGSFLKQATFWLKTCHTVGTKRISLAEIFGNLWQICILVLFFQKAKLLHHVLELEINYKLAVRHCSIDALFRHYSQVEQHHLHTRVQDLYVLQCNY
mgnify:CR=1 FL=1